MKIFKISHILESHRCRSKDGRDVNKISQTYNYWDESD